MEKRGSIEQEFNFVGRWAFLIGIFLSILEAFIDVLPDGTNFILLTVLGLIVGLFNVKGKNDIPFLIGVIALIVIGIAGIEITSVFGKNGAFYAEAIFRNYVTFVASAGFVVAKKLIFSVSRVPGIHFS